MFSSSKILFVEFSLYVLYAKSSLNRNSIITELNKNMDPDATQKVTPGSIWLGSMKVRESISRVWRAGC